MPLAIQKVSKTLGKFIEVLMQNFFEENKTIVFLTLESVGNIFSRWWATQPLKVC